MKKVLIIGGAGYIGSITTLCYLRSNNYDVCVVDNLEKSNINVINKLEKLSNKKVNFIKIDIRNKIELDKVFSVFMPNIVLNFAGYKSVAEGEIEKEKYTENNVIGSRNILENCIKYNVNRFIFSSSAATYGNPKYLPINESHPQSPINHYGWTKLQTELNMQEFSNKGLECIALRYFNAIGAEESGLLGEDSILCANLVPVIINTILGKREKTLIFGNNFNTKDGYQERDYIDVCDLAKAHLLAAESKMNNRFEVYNLSNSNPVSCKKIIDIIEEITNKKLNYEITSPRMGDPERLFADNTKAKRELN